MCAAIWQSNDAAPITEYFSQITAPDPAPQKMSAVTLSRFASQIWSNQVRTGAHVRRAHFEQRGIWRPTNHMLVRTGISGYRQKKKNLIPKTAETKGGSGFFFWIFSPKSAQKPKKIAPAARKNLIFGVFRAPGGALHQKIRACGANFLFF